MLFFLLGGCGNVDRFQKENIVLEKLKAAGIDVADYKAIIFIASSGCSGCISTAEDLLIKQHRKNDVNKILFVLARYASVKQARIRLGSDIVKSDAVIVDINNDYGDFLEQYPVAFFLNDNGELEDVSMIKPGAEEDLFGRLDELVN